MSTQPPPTRPPGRLDLLDPASDASPRDGESAEDWRADALARSRHSRLASELREPLDQRDPERAERVCAEVTRDALGDFAPALILLSPERRRRVQALTAWTVALFDLALRPGLAGLDGDRLAQINAWEFRTEEALEGSPPGQPVFVLLEREERERPWPREALDEIVASARQMALTARQSSAPSAGDRGEDAASERLGRALAAALVADEVEQPAAAEPLAILLGISIELARRASSSLPSEEQDRLLATLSRLALADAPGGWRPAARYVRRALVARIRAGTPRNGLGLATRLRLLALSFLG